MSIYRSLMSITLDIDNLLYNKAPRVVIFLFDYL